MAVQRGLAALATLLAAASAQAQAPCALDAAAGETVLNDCPLAEMQLATNETTELRLESVTFRTPFGDEVTTKAINGQIPAPLLRWPKGGAPTLRFRNVVSGCSSSGSECRSNLHTHGLHVSGLTDNISVEVPPGEEHRYDLEISGDHAGGIHWYHTHVHYLSELQVSGGAAGPLVVADHESNELPAEILRLPEHVLFVLHFQPARTLKLAAEADDSQFRVAAAGNEARSYYMVNGFLEPVLRVPRGRWTRLRMVHASTTHDALLTLTEGSCEVLVLGRDGVYYAGGPRRWPGDLQLTHSSRTDLLVRCEADDAFEVKSGYDGSFKIMTLRADAPAPEGAPLEPPAFRPCLPKYLADTRGESDVRSDFTIRVEKEDINGKSYAGVGGTHSQHNMTLGTVEELNVRSDRHPLHLHVFHMQVQEDVDAWTMAGDWVDTIEANTRVRLRLDHFAGPVVMHCHELQHEDQGSMGVMYVNGGAPNFAPWEEACPAAVEILKGESPGEFQSGGSGGLGGPALAAAAAAAILLVTS